MSSNTKLIILTDDVKLIERFQFGERSHIEIVDLTNKINEQDRTQLKVKKKTSNICCVICGGNGIGNNYNVFSCGSCKIFFRRNSNQDLVRDEFSRFVKIIFVFDFRINFVV